MGSYLELVKRAKQQAAVSKNGPEIHCPPYAVNAINALSLEESPGGEPEIHCPPYAVNAINAVSPDKDLAGVDAVVDGFRRRFALELALANIPVNARLYFADATGLPCVPEAAVSWAWDGGPTWFKVADYPLPPLRMVLGRHYKGCCPQRRLVIV
jgi:hypothetical protein